MFYDFYGCFVEHGMTFAAVSVGFGFLFGLKHVKIC